MGYIQKDMLKVKNAGRRKEEAILSSQRRSTWKNTRIFYLKKLKDTLKIAGFNMNDLRQEKLLLSEHA